MRTEWLPTRRRVALRVAGTVVLAVAASGLAGCSDDSGNGAGTAPTTRAAGTSTTTAAGPATGAYTNDAADGPHYVMDITAGSGGAFSGAMTFVFQDGTTEPVFTFTGETSGSSATVTPSTGAPFSMAFAEGQLTLTKCAAYLRYAVQASLCTFTAQ